MDKENANTLREARRLYRLGFGVHWLRPKSKMPLESGWTTGPRKDWEYLEKTYSEPLNVGVRLGAASKINERGYLCVIDVDVKSTDDADRKAALAKVKELTGGALCPVVLSGRGNGSRHYYCVTEKPFPPYDYAKSEKTVEVYMPSSPPSKKEKEQLSAERLADGFRLRKAWEISVMSEGRQVVLPPSIHPDSGKPYAWKAPFDNISALPLLTLGEGTPEVSGKKEKPDTHSGQEDAFTFEVTPVDLALIDLSKRIREGILTGEGVEDRSAFLLPACTALHSAGLNRDEILTVLTNVKYWLGECAFEHAKTKDRKRAARWLWQYTLKRVLSERSAQALFAEAATFEERTVTGTEREEQDESLRDGIYYSKDNGFYNPGKGGALVPDYDALLQAFEEAHPYRTIADMKGIFLWNGTHYEESHPYEVKAFAEESFDPKPTEKARAEFLSKVLANRVQRRSFFIETTEGRFNFKNGTVDLRDKDPVLLPHSPEIGFRGVLPYEYDPKAKCPVFTEWLASVMLDDKELFYVLQEFMGYVLRGGDYKFHKALWLDGVGRNGKSTFIDVLKALIGPGNYSTISIRALIQDKFAGEALDGKIANFSEETSPQELADSGPFKNLTGDGEIFAQKKFGDPYSFRNRAKLIMSYNQIPDLKDLSPGMLARPLIVPFRKRIAEEDQDRNLKSKLLAELPGIFNFALRGWKRLDRQGHFTYSAKSALALKKTAEESCNAFQWVENYVQFDHDAHQEFSPRDLYTAYRGREKFAYPFNKFMRRINAHLGIKNCRTRTSEKRCYKGLLLK